MSDGGDTVRDLQLYLTPEGEHILDWFHVTMRLTVMEQMVAGLRAKTASGEELGAIGAIGAIGASLESVKHYLWHGNTYRALEGLDDLKSKIRKFAGGANTKPLAKALREFETYVRLNVAFIPNYGDRYRHGEPVATAFIESTVNQVVSKRFVKKQQMRWTQCGAHLVLQTRTRVLNDELRARFEGWYPSMTSAA